jgi:hypothetical protein
MIARKREAVARPDRPSAFKKNRESAALGKSFWFVFEKVRQRVAINADRLFHGNANPLASRPADDRLARG